MTNRPKVSAMYYVNNEEEFSVYSILSIYNVVDEIVVIQQDLFLPQIGRMRKEGKA